jgi:hypothetical protein
MGAKPGEYKGYGWHMIPQMLKCDWVGVAIVLAFGICLILGFEWGVSISCSSSVQWIRRFELMRNKIG